MRLSASRWAASVSALRTALLHPFCCGTIYISDNRQQRRRSTATHTATSTNESMSIRSFTSQWPDGVNGLLELQKVVRKPNEISVAREMR